jgi:hypothetical protein
VKRARAGRALERLERVASWAWGRKRAGAGGKEWDWAGWAAGLGLVSSPFLFLFQTSLKSISIQKKFEFKLLCTQPNKTYVPT